MPRNFFKKLIPEPHTIKQNRLICLFGELLHELNLWHLNRRSVAGALGIGSFFMWWPVPIQMYLSAIVAIVFKVNLPLSVATVWITNPFTVAPMFYFAYVVGTWLVGAPELEFAFEPSLDWLMSLGPIWPPFLAGCLFLAVSNGILSYLGINAIWTYSVLKRRSDRSRYKDK